MRVSVQKSGDARKSRGNRSRTHVVLVVVVIVYVTCGLDRRFLARLLGLVVSCWRHGRRYSFGFVEREDRRYTLWVLSDRFKGRKLADATATPRSPAPVNRTRFSPTLYCQEKAPGQRGPSRESSSFYSWMTGYFSEAVLMKSGFGEILVREVVNFDNFANFGFFPHARLGWRNADSLFSECLFRVQPRIQACGPVRGPFRTFSAEIIWILARARFTHNGRGI